MRPEMEDDISQGCGSKQFLLVKKNYNFIRNVNTIFVYHFNV